MAVASGPSLTASTPCAGWLRPSVGALIRGRKAPVELTPLASHDPHDRRNQACDVEESDAINVAAQVHSTTSTCRNAAARRCASHEIDHLGNS